MKTIVPFTKSIEIQGHVAEITSISLEHELHIDNDSLNGDFIISGDYKTHEISINKEPFSYRLPFSVELGDNIDINSVNFEIADFNYELKESILEVAIEFCIEAEEKEPEIIAEEPAVIEEVEVIEENRSADEDLDQRIKDEIELFVEPEIISEEPVIIEEKIPPVAEDKKEEIKEEPIIETKEELVTTENRLDSESEQTILNAVVTDNDNNITYHVHIVREGDTVESIAQKYNVGMDVIKYYNDTDDILIGDKLLIPNEEVE